MTASCDVETVVSRPDDWHVHLRDGSMLDAVVKYSARCFRYGLVMPNLRPPVTSTAMALAYRERIVLAAAQGPEGAGSSSGFVPLMTLYLNDQVDVDDLRRGWESGVVSGVKFYPAGATTNSDAGNSSLLEMWDTLVVMAELNIPLLVHAESTDADVDVFDREAVFLESELAPLLERLPELTVTVEHVSTAAGVALVRHFRQAWGSITPHHLSHDRTHLLADGLRPDLYCKPVINSAEDRIALVEAATSGDRNFFLGTDSAPHPRTAKYSPIAAAGVFNAANGLAVVAEVFHQNEALNRLEAFVSHNGARRYGYEAAAEKLRLIRSSDDSERCLRQTWSMPTDTIMTSDGDEVTVFGASDAGRWRIETI